MAALYIINLGIVAFAYYKARQDFFNNSELAGLITRGMKMKLKRQMEKLVSFPIVFLCCCILHSFGWDEWHGGVWKGGARNDGARKTRNDGTRENGDARENGEARENSDARENGDARKWRRARKRRARKRRAREYAQENCDAREPAVGIFPRNNYNAEG